MSGSAALSVIFAYFGALFLVANVAETIWLGSIPATVGG
jgi:hypothetical protein